MQRYAEIAMYMKIAMYRATWSCEHLRPSPQAVWEPVGDTEKQVFQLIGGHRSRAAGAHHLRFLSVPKK